MSNFVPKSPMVDAIVLPCDVRLACGDAVTEIEAKAGDVLAVVYGRLQVWNPDDFNARFRPAKVCPTPRTPADGEASAADPPPSAPPPAPAPATPAPPASA